MGLVKDTYGTYDLIYWDTYGTYEGTYEAPPSVPSTDFAFSRCPEGGAP